ncbi:MAG: hypothetical protein WD689_07975 [Gaiellaceae bacterium]
MGLRSHRGAGRRRARLGRPDTVGLAVALYATAGAAATWPALKHADESFLALAEPGHGEAAPGDHLQLTYQLWLVGHRLAQAATPWTDPYSFGGEGVTVLQGWLFGLPLWPFFAAAGPEAAWNVLVLLSYPLAGCLAYGWLRSLGLPRGAALAGGLVFAVFPYRVAQSTGHLLGPISALLPATLWALERRRYVLAAAALAAIPLSGQLHLALGAIPLAIAYGAVRGRWLGAAAAALPAIGAGLAVAQLTVEGSIAEQGRSLAAVSFFSPDWQDFLVRELRHPPPIGPEFALFMGWVTPFAALAGLVLLLRARRYGLAGLLAGAVAVPVWLALGTTLPTYELLWEYVPGFGYPRVPERLMPIAGLAIGALVAFVVARRPRPAVVAAALVLIALDLRIDAYGPAAADPDNRAYAALEGPVLELPVFPADRHWNSVYLYYAMQQPGERAGGYSTTAPPGAARALIQLTRANCGAERPGGPIVLHEGLYRASPLILPECLERVKAALRRIGLRETARDGPVALFTSP